MKKISKFITTNRNTLPEPNRVDYSQTSHFAEGKEAYRAGRKSCPYPMSSGNPAREAWWNGFYHAQIVERHGATLAKYGVNF